MKILPISSTFVNRNNVRKNNPQNVNYSNSNLTLTIFPMNMIMFKGKVPPELNYAKEFVDKELTPFIEKNKELVGELSSIVSSCKCELLDINSHKVKPRFDATAFDEVKRLKLDRVDENQTQFDNLITKSRKWYAGDEAKEYAMDLVRDGSFRIPSYLKAPYKAFLEMKKDIKNGLANLSLESVAPEIAEKKKNLSELEFSVSMSKRRFDDVIENKRSIEKSFSRPSRHADIPDYIETAKRNMARHEYRLERMKTLVEEGKKELETNRLTEEDRNTLENIGKPAERIIRHNVNKFKSNPEVANTYLGEYEPILENQLNEQARKLVRLSNMILNN